MLKSRQNWSRNILKKLIITAGPGPTIYNQKLQTAAVTKIAERYRDARAGCAMQKVKMNV
jgi:hypothetical protein